MDPKITINQESVYNKPGRMCASLRQALVILLSSSRKESVVSSIS